MKFIYFEPLTLAEAFEKTSNAYLKTVKVAHKKYFAISKNHFNQYIFSMYVFTAALQDANKLQLIKKNVVLEYFRVFSAEKLRFRKSRLSLHDQPGEIIGLPLTFNRNRAMISIFCG